MNTKFNIKVLASFATIAALIAGLYFVQLDRGNGDTKSELIEVKAGYVKVLAALPYIYALETGIFEKHGLKVESIQLGNSNDAATAALTNQVDFVGAGATNAALDGMTAAGKVLQIFTTNNYSQRPDGQSTDFLLSSSDFDTIESLRGQPIAFFPGSYGRMFARLILPKYGLQPKDIQYVEMAPGQWLAAMQSGSVKAVTALEPFATKIMSSMDVNILVDGYYAQVLQNIPASGSWFIEGHLQKDVERKIFLAMAEAIREIAADRAKANAVIAEVFSLEPSFVSNVRMMDWGTVDEPETLAALKEYAKILEEEGGIARPAPENYSWIWQE